MAGRALVSKQLSFNQTIVVVQLVYGVLSGAGLDMVDIVSFKPS